MLLVKTKIGPSKINRTGLFAAQFIPKGAPTWKFQSGFDLKIDKSELSNLSEPAKEQFLKYAYLNPKTNKYILCFDDARFFNHSDNPNCIDTESLDDTEGIDVAIRDIQEGEELTCNYKEFDADFDYKMSIH
ncbi:MAG: SET domain-containing protein [Patescibacteria group bacterium]